MAGRVTRAAVVGASTLLGKEVVGEISDSAATAWDLHLLEEGDEIEGQLTAAGEEAVVMHALNREAFTGLDVVLFAGPSAQTAEYLPVALKAGAAVVDLSGTATAEPGFLLRSPWMEASSRPDLTTAGVVTPHVAALMLALLAERLERRFGRVDLSATVLEPASESGSAGVDELHQQTVGLLSFQEVPKSIFDVQVAFNLQGRLGEEAKPTLSEKRTRMQASLARLLGASGGARVSVNLLQAPVFHGYVASIRVQLEQDATPEAVRAAVAGGLMVAEEDTHPSNQGATETGEILVSVEAEAGQARSFWLVLAADNLRLAARNAVQAALELVALRPGKRVQ